MVFVPKNGGHFLKINENEKQTIVSPDRHEWKFFSLLIQKSQFPSSLDFYGLLMF